MDWIEQSFSERLRLEAEVVERACEAALADPASRGVRVDRYADRVEATLSADVPYGTVHEIDHTRP